jgi:hypothetical protein
MITPVLSITELTVDAERSQQWLTWRPQLPAEPQTLTIAELAECQCPDLCDRDHPNE